MWEECFQFPILISIIQGTEYIPSSAGFFGFSSFLLCSKTVPIKDDLCWIFMESSLEIRKLSSVNKVTLV